MIQHGFLTTYLWGYPMRPDSLGSRCRGPLSLLGGRALGGAGGLGGEAAAFEPQATVPSAGTDVVAKDARRFNPRVLGIKGHVGVRGRAAVGKGPGRRRQWAPGTGAG